MTDYKDKTIFTGLGVKKKLSGRGSGRHDNNNELLTFQSNNSGENTGKYPHMESYSRQVSRQTVTQGRREV